MKACRAVTVAAFVVLAVHQPTHSATSPELEELKTAAKRVQSLLTTCKACQGRGTVRTPRTGGKQPAQGVCSSCEGSGYCIRRPRGYEDIRPWDVRREGGNTKQNQKKARYYSEMCAQVSDFRGAASEWAALAMKYRDRLKDSAEYQSHVREVQRCISCALYTANWQVGQNFYDGPFAWDSVRTLANRGAEGKVVSLPADVISISSDDEHEVVQVGFKAPPCPTPGGCSTATCFVIVPEGESWKGTNHVRFCGIVTGTEDYVSVQGASQSAYVVAAFPSVPEP